MRIGRMIGLLMLVVLAGLGLTSCRNLAADPPRAEGEPLTIGTTHLLPSAALGGTRTINVAVPAGYDDSDAAYPVLYLVDGGFAQDFLPMAGLAALASLSGQYRPFILVGVQTENRYHELTSPSDLPEDLQYIPLNGGAEAFRQHLANEVKLFIEDHYRTSGEDAIIGESLAALFIAETFLRTPDAFDHFVAISPSLWWRDMALSHEAAALLQAADFPAGRSFYLTVASEGGTMLEGVERLAAALAAHASPQLAWWYEPLPDEHHHTIYQPAALRALRLVFAPPPATD